MTLSTESCIGESKQHANLPVGARGVSRNKTARLLGMVEKAILHCVRSFTRPVLLTELMDSIKLHQEKEVSTCVSEMCRKQKLCTKRVTERKCLVWENKDSLLPQVNVTPRKPFKIPRPSNSTPQRNSESTDRLIEEVETAKEKLHSLECEVKKYSNYKEKLQLHISKLHEYNEIKDSGIVLIGKLAEVECLTTTDLYEAFDLQLED